MGPVASLVIVVSNFQPFWFYRTHKQKDVRHTDSRDERYTPASKN